ncbi:MAG: tetratricopeptide repeat protein, partial [Nitrospirae bacterium]|nr:tetratricopeptide repeat protein [Nitrospirota bacterium]
QIYAVERPQIFSFLFFAILLYLLDEMKRNSRAEDQQSSSITERQSDRATVASADSPPPQADHRFMVRRAHHDKPCHPEPVEGHLFTYCSLPLLMLLWANMHAGFIVGQGIILIYLLSEGLKFIHPSFNPMDRSSYVKFLIIGISAILAAFINPNAYSAVTEMWRTSKFVSTGLTITEHRSTIALFKDYYPLYIPVYWLLLSIASISLLFRVIKKRLDIQDIFMLAGFGYFSFTQLRYVAFFLIWAVPFISNTTTVPCPTGARTERRGLMYAYLFLSLSVITFLVIGQGEYKFLKNTAGFKNGRWISRYFPEAAVRFIVKNNIKGNMYNYYDWGGYLIWGFYPGKKVAVDGRNLYEVQYIRDTAVLTAASRPVVNGMPYYKAILESYGIRYMVIPLFGIDGVMFPIVAEMIKDKEWIPVFMSDNSMIFVKNTLENYAVVHTYSIPKDIFVVYLFRMLDNAIKGTPKNFFLYLAKADLYYSQSRFKEAKEEYEKVLKINPFNTFARKKLESIDGFIR